MISNSSALLKKEITNSFWSAVFQWEVRIIALKKNLLMSSEHNTVFSVHPSYLMLLGL